MAHADELRSAHRVNGGRLSWQKIAGRGYRPQWVKEPLTDYKLSGVVEILLRTFKYPGNHRALVGVDDDLQSAREARG